MHVSSMLFEACSASLLPMARKRRTPHLTRLLQGHHDVVMGVSGASSRAARPTEVQGLAHHMTWTTWVAVLLIWPVVGLGVAWLFGRLVRGIEVPGNASQLTPPEVSYLRRHKRTNASARARASAQTKARREATSGRRAH